MNEKLGKLVVKRIEGDFFVNDAKLGMSAATASPVSSLIHTGVNIIKPEDTNTKSKGLTDFSIDPAIIAPEVLERYTKENEKISIVRCKTRWVE